MHPSRPGQPLPCAISVFSRAPVAAAGEPAHAAATGTPPTRGERGGHGLPCASADLTDWQEQGRVAGAVWCAPLAAWIAPQDVARLVGMRVLVWAPSQMSLELASGITRETATCAWGGGAGR